jgi:hypothetical protein
MLSLVAAVLFALLAVLFALDSFHPGDNSAANWRVLAATCAGLATLTGAAAWITRP